MLRQTKFWLCWKASLSSRDGHKAHLARDYRPRKPIVFDLCTILYGLSAAFRLATGNGKIKWPHTGTNS